MVFTPRERTGSGTSIVKLQVWSCRSCPIADERAKSRSSGDMVSLAPRCRVASSGTSVPAAPSRTRRTVRLCAAPSYSICTLYCLIDAASGSSFSGGCKAAVTRIALPEWNAVLSSASILTVSKMLGVNLPPSEVEGSSMGRMSKCRVLLPALKVKTMLKDG